MPTENTQNYKTKPQLEVDKLLSEPAIDFNNTAYDKLLEDLQANILKYHRKKIVKYQFIKFENVDSAFKGISQLAEFLPSAKKQLKNEKRPCLNLFLTYEGYNYLRIPDSIIPTEEAFRMGIKNRIKLGKDSINLDLGTAHIILFLAGDSDEEVDGIEQMTQEVLDSAEIIHEEKGCMKNPLDDGFHFKEGMSNPKFFPGAISSNFNYIAPSQVSPLKMVLESDKGGNHQFSCGSYGTFLKFLIDEKAITLLANSVAEVITNKKKVSKNAIEKALALIVGRFRDGTPITLQEKPNGKAENNFNYQEFVKAKRVEMAQTDEQGSRCPFHAHIRKANPRVEGNQKYSITRRGTYYEQDGQKGLLFASFQKSLAKQFEYVLNNWILNEYTDMNSENYGQAKLIKTKKDILFAKKGEKYSFLDTWNAYDKGERKSEAIQIEKALIHYLGGIYYYAPSISFLKKIGCYNPKRQVDIHQEHKKNFKQKPPSFIEGTQIFLTKGNEVVKGGIAFLPNTSIKLKPKK